jgi:hypothetical protein
MRHEVEILEAQEFACEYYNIPRRKFVELAAKRYPRNAYLFQVAIRCYDEIQTDMMEIA